jgi:tetratricopeptide (TPR) repeat protein
MLIDSAQQDWSGVLSDADALPPILQKYPGMRSWLPTYVTPVTAYAEARLGKLADADAHISATPSDCYNCLITRAQIAELQGQHGRADYWFARAIDGQKSIPFASSYWGEALMGRGDYDGAIGKFAIANQKGPHFADPLEGWGEALMAKNQSHLALPKFGEAEKYAPNWGRLHLKWGEALFYAGHKDEAHAQYQKASTLDLTTADKAELARVSANV